MWNRDATNLVPDGVCGIYAIRNTVTGQCYVGSSWDVRGRWRGHRWQLRKGVHKNKRLQSDWLAFGESVFTIDILEHVGRDLPHPHWVTILPYERRWYDAISAPLYNEHVPGGRERKPYTRKEQPDGD